VHAASLGCIGEVATLFNLCNCAAPLASSAAPFCAGGAGFIAAVIATLATHAGGEERNVLVDFGFTPEVLNNNIAIIEGAI
jgi:hypothetical protein